MKHCRHELVLAGAWLALAAGISLVNPAFLSLANLFDLLKAGVVTGILALAVLIVLVSGGIDISFTAIAAFAMYASCRVLVAAGSTDGAVAGMLLATAIGAGLGMVNALFIGALRLPTLIVTLGTAGLFRGCLLAFVGTGIINNLPAGLIRLSRWQLFRQTSAGGETIGLSAAVLALAAVAVGVALLLQRTVTGRSIHALGGNAEAAERIGIRTGRLQCFIYTVVGALAGLAGILHAITMRNANPFDLVGAELTVIAAVVLGGADVFGGRGTVTGTLLGVFLLVTLNNSLILLGVPTYWQRVWIGAIILISVAVSARNRRAAASPREEAPAIGTPSQ